MYWFFRLLNSRDGERFLSQTPFLALVEPHSMHIERDARTGQSPLDDCPFNDEVPELEPVTSIESIRSFWIGVAGLAVIAHVAIFLELLAMNAIDKWYWKFLSSLQGQQWVFDLFSSMHYVTSKSLLPCICLATVTPILYWRGGLLQRFALSLAIVVATMNSSAFRWAWGNSDHHPIVLLISLVTCWIMFPILFLFTPIRTKNLRLIVATCLLILTVCASFITMAGLRSGNEFLHWQSFFGLAFLYAILRRNWGKVAIIESSATDEQIERTSSGTLLELMVVWGLASASYLYFSQSQDRSAILYYFLSSVLGLVCLLACISLYQRSLSAKRRNAFRFLFLWLAIACCMSLNAIESIDFRRNIIFSHRKPSAFGLRQGSRVLAAQMRMEDGRSAKIPFGQINRLTAWVSSTISLSTSTIEDALAKSMIAFR
jgi:hypothetical protein